MGTFRTKAVLAAATAFAVSVWGMASLSIAFAADPAATSKPTVDWTGLYIGAHAGMVS